MNHPDLSFFCNFVRHIIQHPSQYNTVHGVNPIIPSESDTSGVSPTNGFVSYVSCNAVSSSTSTITSPVLKIIEISQKVKTLGKMNGVDLSPDHKQTVWTLTAVDGDNNPITIKSSTQLIPVMGTVQVGSLIQCISWTVLPFNTSTIKNYSCEIDMIMLLYQFYNRGYMPVCSDEVNLARAKHVPVSSISKNSNLNHEEAAKDKSSASHHIPNSNECSESNRICSRYGVGFTQCICKVVPPTELDLQSISRSCIFVSKDTTDMNNSDKRFVLYYWYATNIYHVSGRHNRIELPECLIGAIRKLFPSTDKRYAGFKQAVSKKHKKQKI